MIVSLPCAGRPLVLKKTLRHLSEAIDLCPEKVRVVICREPGDDEVARLLDSFNVEDDCLIRVNEHRMGLQANTYQVLNLAFDLAESVGEDFVVHLEDDIYMGPDALNLFCWIRDTYRDDPSVVFGGMKNIDDPPDKDDYLRVLRTDWFGCHLWGAWDRTWLEMQDVWHHENEHFWARFMNDDLMKGRDQIIPRLSRAIHDDKDGVHTHPNPECRPRETQLFSGDVILPAGDYFEQGRVPSLVREQV